MLSFPGRLRGTIGVAVCSIIAPMAAAHRKLVRLDLRGIKCPLNWAHAKLRLEKMRRGETLELLLDDPRGARDIPRAAEAEGYSITESAALNGIFRLRIEK